MGTTHSINESELLMADFGGLLALDLASANKRLYVFRVHTPSKRCKITHHFASSNK